MAAIIIEAFLLSLPCPKKPELERALFCKDNKKADWRNVWRN